jgi:YggT family protein
MDIVLGPLLQVILIVLDLYVWVILTGVILSWLVAFNVVNTHNRFVNIVGDVVYRLTEPLQAPIRRVLPNFSGLDLSPMVLILGVIFARGVVEKLLYNLG